MEGKSVAEHKFSKKEEVNTLASSVYVSVDGEKIEIDPQQLYQRLLVAGIGNFELQTLFQYELCSYPSSLFDKKLLMRLADKADLLNALIAMVPSSVVTESPIDAAYVIDGRALIHHVSWPKSISYTDLCKIYVEYLLTNYRRALVVFDGYASGPSTKDETHQRRIGSEMGVDVDFSPDMLINMKKHPFCPILEISKDSSIF